MAHNMVLEKPLPQQMAKFQVQIYAWLLEPHIKELGYNMWKRMWVEVYSQKDEHLIKRIPVEPIKDMDKVLKDIVETWQGLKGMKYPPEWICHNCPRNIKKVCGRFPIYD